MREETRQLVYFLKYPGKLINFLGCIFSCLLRLKRVPFLPSCVDVEPNNTCNLQCRHCQVSHWDKKPEHLSLDSFLKVVDQFPHLMYLKVQGMGEPLLNKDLPSMLAEGTKRGAALSTFSNGMLLTNNAIKELLKLKRVHIGFSFDGATKDSFETIRAGGDFYKVCENIKHLVLQRKSGGITISLWTLVTNLNKDELSDIVLLAKELGVDHITFQTRLTHWGKEEMKAPVEKICVGLKDVERAFAEAKRVARRCGVRLRITREDLYTKKKKCRWPWLATYISSSGDVVPCCILGDSDTARMGNIFETPFKEIWNNDRYLELRSKIAKHDLPRFCENCYRL